MNTKPCVTVVVPCYNQRQFLEECLKSVIAQTIEDWVCIVVDDGSNLGDPVEVVDLLSDERIHPIRHQANLGLSAARNTGFLTSSTPLVLTVDADDYLAPTFLEKTLNALNREPKAHCAFSHFRVFGIRNCEMRWGNPSGKKVVREQCIPGAGVLMRKSLWERAGGYCEEEPFRSYSNEDWDFWMTVFETGSCVAIQVPEALYYYRTHFKSLMHTKIPLHSYETRLAMLRRHWRLFEKQGGANFFLSEGCVESATALYEQGEASRATHMAIRALRYNPFSSKSALLLAKCILPRRWVMLQRQFRQRRNRGRTTSGDRSL
jgi:glycosyltransferase involved in cell wall biosynthesis